MSLAGAISAYSNLNFLILIGFLGLAFFSMLVRVFRYQMPSRTELRLHYAVIALVLAMSIIHPFLPKAEVFSPAAKVWSAQSFKSFNQEDSLTEPGGYLALPSSKGAAVIDTGYLVRIWLGLAAILFAVGGAFLSKDVAALLRIKRRSFLVRQMGRVRILVNEKICVPFSFWLPGQANVVIPSALLGKTEYQIVVAHELQHHRQQDTKWVYVMWALKLVCIINPAVHLWSRWLSQTQEFACDETLVDQNKVESQAYARCLVEVAKTAVDQKYAPVCATGLTFLNDGNLLKRRIEKMLTKSHLKVGRSISVMVGVLIASVMAAASYSSTNLVQDRRVSLAQAKAMAANAQSETGFQVVVNDSVLKQLNRYIGTPEGREFMQGALARMQTHKTLVGAQLKKYGVPLEIMAVPIIESGYQNLSQQQSGTPGQAAGLWQFIPSTARNYGLKVDAKVDERLDAQLLTDAAMRYLTANHMRFKDWQLSALAFNMGEANVQKGIDATGSRDAWTLIRSGHEGDKDYLAKLMAAILIMKNPGSIE